MTESVADDGYLTVTLSPGKTSESPGLSGRRVAKISSSGTEMVLLKLDDQYAYRDFDYHSDCQREILRRMVRLAEAYFNGEGREIERRGFLGRRVKEFELSLEGEASGASTTVSVPTRTSHRLSVSAT